MVVGVEFRKELFVVALGIDKTGSKTILGYHQGATENQEICDRLLAGIAARGLNLRHGMLAILDESGALGASIRSSAGTRSWCSAASNISNRFIDILDARFGSRR